MHTLDAADEHAQGRGVDERHLRKVDHHVGGAFVDERHDLVLEPRRSVEVDLAGDLYEAQPLAHDGALGSELSAHGEALALGCGGVCDAVCCLIQALIAWASEPLGAS